MILGDLQKLFLALLLYPQSTERHYGTAVAEQIVSSAHLNACWPSRDGLPKLR